MIHLGLVDGVCIASIRVCRLVRAAHQISGKITSPVLLPQYNETRQKEQSGHHCGGIYTGVQHLG